MSTTADVVFITDDIDHATLTTDRLPARPSLLPCARCGTPRGRHRSRDCGPFTRPALPAGHAYLDRVRPGTAIRLPRDVTNAREHVRSLEPAPAGMTHPMLHLRTAPAWPLPGEVSRYVAADTIVEI